MRLGSMLAFGLLAAFGGCQMCDNCSDFAPPAYFTAPGEIYAGQLLPAGPPVVPRGAAPPALQEAEPGESPMDPTPERLEPLEPESPLARRPS